MVGLTLSVVTIREHTSGDEYTKEAGEIPTIRMDVGGIELDTPDNTTFISAIMFNTKITEKEYRTNIQNEDTQNLL